MSVKSGVFTTLEQIAVRNGKGKKAIIESYPETKILNIGYNILLYTDRFKNTKVMIVYHTLLIYIGFIFFYKV